MDASKVLGLYSSNRVFFEDIPVSEEFLIESAARDDYILLVAEEGGELSGFCGCLYHRWVGRGELGPIAVDEKQRGGGLGSKLIGETLEYVKNKGIRQVYVRVKAGNAKGISFFMKNGFYMQAFLRNHTMQCEDAVQLVTCP
jgi:ribosomal protein S18 acetylase RimI-like enzyme